MTTGARFIRSERALFRDMGDVVYVTWQGRQDFDALEGTATLLWGLLSRATSEDDIVETLAETYGTPIGAIDADVRRTLDDWIARGLAESAERANG